MTTAETKETMEDSGDPLWERVKKQFAYPNSLRVRGDINLAMIDKFVRSELALVKEWAADNKQDLSSWDVIGDYIDYDDLIKFLEELGEK